VALTPHNFAAPRPQRPYDLALRIGFETLAMQPPTAPGLADLGAVMEGDVIGVPALNRRLAIDLGRREARVDGAGLAKAVWAVLAVHYLCSTEAARDAREVSFSCFHDCRNYLSVFGKRIVARFLATTGRTARQFALAGERIGGVLLPGPGLCYRFDVLPRVPIVIARYEGDSEVTPGASVIYRADAERLLPPEDRVVAAELLLDALAGKSMSEEGGSYA
jgi:hypothetical protein